MKPCIYFSPKANKDNFEGARLRKNIKGALEIKNIDYAKSIFDRHDLVHFISLDDESKIDDALENNVKVVFSALTCENDPAARILSYKSSNEAELSVKAGRVLNKVDRIFVPSEKARDYLVKNDIISPISIVTPGVNLSRFVLTGDASDNVFFDYNQIERGTKFIVSIGTYEKKEQLLRIIEIAKLCPKYMFFFIGVEGKERKLFKIKNIPSNLRLSPVVNDEIYCSMMKNASIYLVLNSNSASPLTLLDAMASKTQIISATMDEAIYLNETRAYACASLEETANLINTYMEGNIASTIDEAYEFAKENSLSKLGEELEKEYDLVLKGNTKND